MNELKYKEYTSKGGKLPLDEWNSVSSIMSEQDILELYDNQPLKKKDDTQVVQQKTSEEGEPKPTFPSSQNEPMVTSVPISNDLDLNQAQQEALRQVPNQDSLALDTTVQQPSMDSASVNGASSYINDSSVVDNFNNFIQNGGVLPADKQPLTVLSNNYENQLSPSYNKLTITFGEPIKPILDNKQTDFGNGIVLPNDLLPEQKTQEQINKDNSDLSKNLIIKESGLLEPFDINNPKWIGRNIGDLQGESYVNDILQKEKEGNVKVARNEKGELIDKDLKPITDNSNILWQPVGSYINDYNNDVNKFNKEIELNNQKVSKNNAIIESQNVRDLFLGKKEELKSPLTELYNKIYTDTGILLTEEQKSQFNNIDDVYNFYASEKAKKDIKNNPSLNYTEEYNKLINELNPKIDTQQSLQLGKNFVNNFLLGFRIEEEKSFNEARGYGAKIDPSYQKGYNSKDDLQEINFINNLSNNDYGLGLIGEWWNTVGKNEIGTSNYKINATLSTPEGRADVINSIANYINSKESIQKELSNENIQREKFNNLKNAKEGNIVALQNSINIIQSESNKINQIDAQQKEIYDFIDSWKKTQVRNNKKEQEFAKTYSGYQNGEILPSIKIIAGNTVNGISDAFKSTVSGIAQLPNLAIRSDEYNDVISEIKKPSDFFGVKTSGMFSKYYDYESGGKNIRYQNGNYYELANGEYKPVNLTFTDIANLGKAKEGEEFSIAGMIGDTTRMATEMALAEFTGGIALKGLSKFSQIRNIERAVNVFGEESAFTNSLQRLERFSKNPTNNGYFGWFTQTIADNYQEGKAKGMTNTQASVYGSVQSLLTSFLSRINPDVKFFKTYKEIDEKLIGSLLKNDKQGFLNNVKSLSNHIGGEISSETGQELTEQFSQELVKQFYNTSLSDKKFDRMTADDVLKTVITTAITTGALTSSNLALRGSGDNIVNYDNAYYNSTQLSNGQKLVMLANLNTNDIFRNFSNQFISDKGKLNEIEQTVKSVKTYLDKIPNKDNYTLNTQTKAVGLLYEIDQKRKQLNKADESFKDDINAEINGLSNELKQLLNDDLKLQNEQPQELDKEAKSNWEKQRNSYDPNKRYGDFDFSGYTKGLGVPRPENDFRTEEQLKDEYGLNDGISVNEFFYRLSNSKFLRETERALINKLKKYEWGSGKVFVKNDTDAFGWYMPSENNIYLNTSALAYDKSGGLERVALHELLHYATSRELKSNSDFKNSINDVLSFVTARFESENGKKAEKFYGIMNVDELISESFSNPELQQWMKGIKYKNTTQSVWDKFIEYLNSLFGYNKNDNTLSEVIALTSNMIDKKYSQRYERPQQTTQQQPTQETVQGQATETNLQPEQTTVAGEQGISIDLNAKTGDTLYKPTEQSVSSDVEAKKADIVISKQEGFKNAGEQSKKENNSNAIADYLLQNAKVGDTLTDKNGEGYEITEVNNRKDGSNEVVLVPFELIDGKIDYSYTGTKLISEKNKKTASDLYEFSYTNANGERINETYTYNAKAEMQSIENNTQTTETKQVIQPIESQKVDNKKALIEKINATTVDENNPEQVKSLANDILTALQNEGNNVSPSEQIGNVQQNEAFSGNEQVQNIEQPSETQNAPLVSESKSTNGKYTIKVEQNSNLGTADAKILDNSGNEVNLTNKQKEKYVAEHFAKQTYPETVVPNADKLQSDEYNQELVKASNNPVELAQILDTESEFIPSDLLNTKENAIANVIGNKVSRSSFIQFDDANNITFSIARGYGLNNKGKGIDVIAQEAEVLLYGDWDSQNPRVTTEDVIDFMKTYNNGADTFFRQPNPTYRDTAGKFEKITGIKATKNALDILLGKKTATKIDFAKLQEEADVLSAEEKYNLRNEYNEWFNSLSLEDKNLELQKTYPYEQRTEEDTNQSKNESVSNRQPEGSKNVANQERNGATTEEVAKLQGNKKQITDNVVATIDNITLPDGESGFKVTVTDAQGNLIEDKNVDSEFEFNTQEEVDKFISQKEKGYKLSKNRVVAEKPTQVSPSTQYEGAVTYDQFGEPQQGNIYYENGVAKIKDKAGKVYSANSPLVKNLKDVDGNAIQLQKGNQRLTPITKQAFDALVKKLQKAFPRFAKVTTDLEKAKQRALELGENITDLEFKTNNGNVYGFKLSDGTIYLNPQFLNANTPIHEFSHLWEQLLPSRFKSGVELLKQTNLGKKLFEQLKQEGNYANLTDEQLWGEALNTHIGNFGENEVNNPKGTLKKLQDWIKDFFAKVGDVLGIKKLTPDTQLRMFTEGVVKDLLGGKPVVAENQVSLSEQVQYSIKGENTETLPSKDLKDIFSSYANEGENKAFEKLQNTNWYKNQSEEIKNQLSPSGMKDFMVEQSQNKLLIADKNTEYNPIKIQRRNIAKIWKEKWFANKGGLIEPFLNYKDKAQGLANWEIRVAKNTVIALNKEAKKVGFTKDSDWEIFNKALEGDLPSIESLPETIKPFINTMRAQIDGLSMQLIENNLVTKEQAITIEENLGKYVTRGYKLFEGQDSVEKISKKFYRQLFKKDNSIVARFNEAKWAEAVTVYQQNVLNEISMENSDKYAELDTEEKKQLFARQEGERRLLEYISSLESDYKQKGSEIGADTSVLEQRKEVPTPIRRLLGEYTDPRTSFLLTVSRVSNLAYQRKFLSQVKDIGMGTLFFKEGDVNIPPTHYVKIASDTNNRYSPLNGLYTTPEFKDVFLDIPENTQNDLVKLWIKATGLVKVGKTVLSPITQAVNFNANFGFLINNGLILDVKQFGKAFQAFADDMTDGKLNNDIVKELVEENILGQNIAFNELEKDFGVNMEKEILRTLSQSKTVKTAKDVLSMPFRLYKASDDFFKAFAYYSEADRYADAYFGKKYKELEGKERDKIRKIASEIVKNTMPNYDRRYKAGDIARKSTYNLLGNFLSFQAESIRTKINSIQYALADIKNEKTRKAGIKRLSGILTYESVYMGITTYLTKSMGMGMVGLLGFFDNDDEDEKNKQFNLMLPEWARATEKYAIQEKDGTITWYAYGNSNPYGIWYKSINAYHNGSTNSKGGLVSVFDELLSPFMGTEMSLKWALNTFISERNDYGVDLLTTKSTVDYTIDKLSPTIVKVIKDNTDSNKTNNFDIYNLIGIKKYNFDPTQQLGYKYNDYATLLNKLASQKYALEKKVENGKATVEEIRASWEDLDNKQKKIADEFREIKNAFVRFGASTDIINEKSKKSFKYEYNGMYEWWDYINRTDEEVNK